MEEYAGPYDAARLAASLGVPFDAIHKLDGNENPYGASPRVNEALANYRYYHLYPDTEQEAMRGWIGEYAGIGPEHLLVGNGSDELIDLLMKAYLDPGDEVMDFPPSFGMYSFEAQHFAAPLVKVERDERFEVDPERAVAALTPRTKLIILTSPNNPTGNPLPPETVARLLASGRIVIVDEAYLEFSRSQSLIPWVPQHENLVVLRTFSKWAGLAGLRIGYAAMPLSMIRQMWKIKQPFSINAAAVEAVRVSLEDREHLLQNCLHIVAERERLFRELQRIDYLRPYPSEANFILCDVLGREASELRNTLAQQAILVRYYRTPRLKNCVRFSVGKPFDTDALLAALRNLA
ncbi:MAG: histidinol-phosphate transaminase [Chloroflexi bacterium]|nr:histidinol-phosphate transaminase [Chloroflexota bacterium]